MDRAPSKMILGCQCRPADRLRTEQVAARLRVSPAEVEELVSAKLLWFAGRAGDGGLAFCPVTIQSLAEDPSFLPSCRKLLAKRK